MTGPVNNVPCLTRIIEDTLAAARRIVLENGTVGATLMVFGSDANAMLDLNPTVTTPDKHAIMRVLGEGLAEAQRIGVLRYIVGVFDIYVGNQQDAVLAVGTSPGRTTPLFVGFHYTPDDEQPAIGAALDQNDLTAHQAELARTLIDAFVVGFIGSNTRRY